MGRVEGGCAVKFYRLAVDTDIEVAHLISRVFAEHGVGIAAPVGKRTIIYTGFLSVGMTVLHKLAVLLRLEAEVPECVEIDHHISVGSVETAAGDIVMNEVGHLDSLVVGDFGLEFAP